MADASRDQNYVTTLLGVSNVDGTTPVKVYADPTTHRLLVDLASGSGTVTDVSVVSANGFAGSVATSTTTPAITLSTTITGILKGNGTAMSAASAGTDYTDNAFKTISVAGQTDVVADSAADTLTLVAGTNVTITTDATTDTITINSSGGASGITIGTTTITSGTDTRILYDNAGVVGEYTLTGSGTVVAMATAPTFQTSINGAYLTASEILITDASKNIVSAAVATYPSLTELSYVKGVTSALQTQLNALMTNPMTTGGDVIYGGASGTPTRLANGTAGYLLQSNGTTLAPTWVTAPASGLTIGTTAITSGTTTRILYDNAGTLGEYTITGTGTVVAMQTSPAFTTPSLGVATATSINGNTFTTGTYTLTGTAAKTLNFTNTLTLSGTDSTTMTFPSTSATIARTDAGQTFTGTQVLAENASIQYDPAGSADGKFTGITVTGTGGATIAFGDVVYLAVADSRWELTDASAEATAGYVQCGIAVSTSTDGNPITVLLNGIIRADTAFPTFTVGAQVFLSETAGDVTQTAPTTADAVIRSVGFAITTDEMYFNPSPDYATHT
jgi:hypothetical protein